MSNNNLRKISRSQLRAFAIGHLKTKQGGLCPLCKKPIDIKTMGHNSPYVVDHDHITGEIRGVLHRGCNGAEGKVFDAIARWGGVGKTYEAVIPFMENLLQYLKQEGCGVMYPDHKTEEEKKQAAKVKAAKARAAAKAKETRLKLAKDRKEI